MNNNTRNSKIIITEVTKIITPKSDLKPIKELEINSSLSLNTELNKMKNKNFT